MKTTPTKRPNVVRAKPEVKVEDHTTNEFVGSGKVNIPYVKQCLELPDPNLGGYAEYMYNVYGLPATCSAMEMNSTHSPAGIARLLVKGKLTAARQMCVVNITGAADIHKKFELFGFKKVFEYQGNHGARVHTYMCDISTITGKYTPTTEKVAIQ